MRLIDADELKEHVWRDRLDSRELIAGMIDNAPTVKEIPIKIPISIFEQLISKDKAGEKSAEQEHCEDAISRQAVLNVVEKAVTKEVARWSIKELPSVKPQIICPIHGVYCEDCSAYEKKLNKWIGAEVLDRIRAEIEQEYNRLRATRADETLELGECLGLKMSLKIIDKYKAEEDEE